MFSHSSIIQRLAFALFLSVLASGCSMKGASEFKRASREYFGCAMTPPWPLEATSHDSTSTSFIRLDDVYSLPIYFRKRADGFWPELSGVPESNIVDVSHAPFEVKRVDAPLNDRSEEFDREFVIIIERDSALILPEGSGDYWQLLLNSCD